MLCLLGGRVVGRLFRVGSWCVWLCFVGFGFFVVCVLGWFFGLGFGSVVGCVF